MNNTDIESLNHRYQILFNDFQANKIDEATFIAEVDKLQFQDEWSRYWMIGAQTGAWHYYDGQTWHQADPRDADKLPIMDEQGIYWQRGVKSGEWYFYDSEQSEWVKPNKNSPTQPTTPQSNIAPEPAMEMAPPAGFEGELFQDNDGRYWATGAKSGQWYYYDHNGWHPAQNFEGAPPFQTQSDPAALTQAYPAYNNMADSQSYLPQPQMYSAPSQPPVQVYVVSPGQEGMGGVGGQQPPQAVGSPAQPVAESSPLPKDDDIRPRQRPNAATNPEENRENGTATSEDSPVVPGESEVPPRQPSRPVGVTNGEVPSQAAAEGSQPNQAPNGGWYYFDGKNWSPSNGDTPSAGSETKSDPPLVQAISVDEGDDEVEVVDVEVIAVVEPEPEPVPVVEPTPVASESTQPEPAIPSPTSAVEWGASQLAASGVPTEEEVQPRRITRPIEPQPPVEEPQEPKKPEPEKQIENQPSKSVAARSRGAVVIPTGEDPANIPIRPSRPTSRPVRPAPRPAPAQQRRMRESTLTANRTPARSETYVSRQTTTQPAPAVQQAPTARTKTDEVNTSQVAQKVAPPAVTPTTPPPASSPINQPMQDVAEQTTFGEFLGAIPLTLRVFAVGIALLALFACGILALGGGFTQLDNFQDNIANLSIPYISDAIKQGIPTPTLDANTIPDASPTLEATATPAEATATATPAGSVTFDSNLGFSLTYPENWDTLETNQAAMFAPTEANLDEGTVTNAALQVGRTDEFDDVADLLAAMLARFPTNAEELNKGSIGVGGDIWTSLQIRYDGDGDSGLEQAVATLAVVLRGENEGYYLLATAPNTQWNELQPVYQEMINSFEFGASGAAIVVTESPTATTVADGLDSEETDEVLETEPTKPTTPTNTPTPKATATPAATATSTNTPTPKATPTSTSTPSPVTYEIQSGDTLGRIAAQYGIETSLLAEENGIDLENHTLQVGDELFIPIPQEALTSQPTPQATVADDDEPETAATSSAASDDKDNSPATSTKPTTGGITADDIAGLKEGLDEIASEPSEISGRIIYPAFDPAPGVYNLWLVDLVNNEQTLLVTEASQPAFSQDGNLLAYRSWSLRDRGIVYRSYLNGKEGQVTNFVEDGLPAWSPDGFSFIFASRREGDRQPRLFRTDYQNKNDSGLGFEGVYPDVFPDGRVVASGCLAGGRDCGLYIMGGDGGGPKKIGPQGDTAPSASPNGKSIAFMSNGRGGSGWEIWTINADGSNPKQLTENGSDDGLPAWSPDGKSIAFVSNQGGSWAVWVMNVDGSNQRKLFDMKGSPNGTVLSDSRNSFGWWEERIAWAP